MLLVWAPAPAAELVTNPFRGITLIQRREEVPRMLSMHIVLVELHAPGIRFKLTPPGGTNDTLRQRTIDFLNQEHAQVAINSHFYLPFPSTGPGANVVGFAAAEGVICSPFEPQPIAPGYLNQAYAILPYAPALNLDPQNRLTIVHRDPSDPDNRRVLEHVVVWNAVSGSAQIVTQGARSIPDYSGPPDGLTPLFIYSQTNSWCDRWKARTVIGVTRNARSLVLFTVDETGGSMGMALGEVADLLIRDYDVENAINLDGDGSTTMAMADPFTGVGRLVNAPSDNPLGRVVANSLAVFAEPLTDPNTALAITHAGTGRVAISWPVAMRGWHLQQCTDLRLSRWKSVTRHPKQVEDRMEVSLPPSATARFFRLVRRESR